MADPVEGSAIFIYSRMKLGDAGDGSFGRQRTSAVFATDAVEFIFPDFAAQRVAVHAQHFCGARLIAVQFFQDSPDEFFFEFRNGLFEQNSALHHESDQRFQLIFHFSRSTSVLGRMAGDDRRNTNAQGRDCMSFPPEP